MNPRSSSRSRGRMAGLTMAALMAAIGTGAVAAPEGTAKQIRQIGIMEGILDKVLLDSPNFRVSGRESTHGIYLNDFGAVFTVEASLTSDDDFSYAFSGPASFFRNGALRGFRVKRGKNGTSMIFGADADSSDTTTIAAPGAPPAPPPPPSSGSAAESLEANAARLESMADSIAASALKSAKFITSDRRGRRHPQSDPAAVYQAGKQEIIQTLLDYGDTMTTLRDDQSIAVAAFLQDSRYFLDNKFSRLLIRARMKDLRDYSAGRISETQMKARVQEEEY